MFVVKNHVPLACRSCAISVLGRLFSPRFLSSIEFIVDLIVALGVRYHNIAAQLVSSFFFALTSKAAFCC